MQKLKEAILSRGKALDGGVLLVDAFLNHQVDVQLLREAGERFAAHFSAKPFSRVVTIESSGIVPAAFTALAMGLPLVIFKKQTSRILTGELLQTRVRSFTKGIDYQLTVKRDFIAPGDCLLFIDDFLASGEAAFGAIELARMAGASVDGVGIVIEKSFQPGRARLEQAGLDVLSLARIRSMSAQGIEFAD